MKALGIWRSAAALTGLLAASAAAAIMARPPVDFLCTVAPRATAKGQPDNSAICASFQREAQRALRSPVIKVERQPSGARARWVRIEVTFPRRNAVEARATSHLAGGVKRHDPIALDVMDKKLGQREVDRLARLVADSITSR